MTKDEVTRLAHEAAGFDGTTTLERPIVLYAAMSKDFLDKFADLVAEQEREACAKVAEEIMRRYKADTALDPDLNKVGAMAAELCALWIRKRGEK
jgi:hypothetical protein